MPWEFARFNLLGGGSAQYGAHPWHWNLTQGLPTVAATLLPLALGGVCLASRCDSIAAWSVVAMSLLATGICICVVRTSQ